MGAASRAISAAAAQVARVVQPAAALAVATEFGFPLLLALAVLGYLLAQGYVDRRDPKLRMAPQHANDGIVAFRTEDLL